MYCQPAIKKHDWHWHVEKWYKTDRKSKHFAHNWHKFSVLKKYYIFSNIIEWNSDQALWLGGYKNNGVWNWDGKSTNPIIVALWAPGHLQGYENCLASYGKDEGKLHDTTCTDVIQFICELVI